MTSTGYVMYSVTRLIDVTEQDRDQVLATARRAADETGARHWIVEPTLPGSRNGGDVLVHRRFDAESEWYSAEPAFTPVLSDPAITHVNGACYRGEATRSRPTRPTV